ncbi:MAG: Flp family type IVb pilin [Candidatus Scalinduaceae bacterium]
MSITKSRLVSLSTTKLSIKVKRLLKLLKDEEGVTALEYSLIAALVFIVIVGTVTALSSSVQDMYNSVVDS